MTIMTSIRENSRHFFTGIFTDWDRTQLLLSFCILGLIALSPIFIQSPYYLSIIILTTLYAFIGISWNIVAGFAGQLLMAHVSFLAIGAYTTIVLYVRLGISPWIGLLVAGFLAAILGILIAFITLRYGLKADYFALFTIALMVALRTLFSIWDFVGSGTGIGLRINDPSWEKMIFNNKEPYLYIALALATIAVFIQYRIYRSKMGRYFVAIREDEAAAAALGVNTSLYKTLAVVIGATMAGVGGGFYGMYVTFVEPGQVFSLPLNVEIVMAAPIIGGLGSLVGPILGAVVNKPLVDLFRGLLAAERSGSYLIVYGLFLVLIILFMPRGLEGILRSMALKLRNNWKKS